MIHSNSALWLLGLAAWLLAPSGLVLANEPIGYTIKVPLPESHVAEVEAKFPTDGRDSIELMMPIWSPGFYRVEDYASKINDFTAKTPTGNPLDVEKPRNNRWKIATKGANEVVVTYRLTCEQHSVTTNWVGPDYAVWNGAATFVTLAGTTKRPHDVRIILPESWKQALTAMGSAPEGSHYQYRANDYDTLVDSPIIAGNPSVHEFDVEGFKHALADIGEFGQWDGAKAARDLERIARENHRFWGTLPFDRKYLFLNVFRPGGGGLEHRDSTLLTSSPASSPNQRPYPSWLSFVSHEYFHAFNVKRLRPVEIDPFDYENPPKTASLWISEGLTSYFGDLMVVRSGVGDAKGFLEILSKDIGQLQSAPGRLVQTLEESSLDVWSSGTSGVGRDKTKTVNYYIKGPIVGFLLDAKIRKATSDAKSLDDVIRLAYRRYSGARGFTPEEFRKTATEIAGTDLGDWFRKTLASTEELDYNEALDWFGLRFAPTEDPAKSWTLEPLHSPSELQKAHLKSWLSTRAGS